MSDLPANTLDYRAAVSEYFLGLRGTGLMLSPLDEEIVAEWERRGIPVPVVCRGLRAGAEELALRHAGAPRSLRALRFSVEDEWRAYRAARVGDAPEPPAEADAAEARLARAREALACAADAAREPHREVYASALRVLASAAGGPGGPLDRVEAAVARADVLVLAGWLAALPAPERRALGPRIRLLSGPRPRGSSRAAYRETLRTHLVEAARRAGLTCLRGTV